LSAGEKEDMIMPAAGQIFNLPVLSPARWMLREQTSSRHPRHPVGAQKEWQIRYYQLPPQERQNGFTYDLNGYAAPECINGTFIDLYA
jgi:hypothetical protein